MSEDIAPVLVALLGKEKTPALMRWAVKDVNEVIRFYSQFSTVDDMKTHIKDARKLATLTQALSGLDRPLSVWTGQLALPITKFTHAGVDDSQTILPGPALPANEVGLYARNEP